MALTDEQRGPRAAWLYRHRVARFGQGSRALEELAQALKGEGSYRAPDTIKGWEASDARSPIPPDVLPALERIFNDQAPRPRRGATPEELVAAIAEQAAAISDLTEELRLARHRQELMDANLLRLLAAIAGRPDLGELPSDIEHSTRVGTAQ